MIDAELRLLSALSHGLPGQRLAYLPGKAENMALTARTVVYPITEDMQADVCCHCGAAGAQKMELEVIPVAADARTITLRATGRYRAWHLDCGPGGGWRLLRDLGRGA